MAKSRLKVGINYPWFNYGWDFGDPPAAWVNPDHLSQWRSDKRAAIEEDFRKFAALGLFAVRWFILADGLSYGLGDEAPRLVENRWTFDPLSVDHPFYSQLCDDFEFAVRACAANDLKLVPSLIDFHWCHSGKVIQDGIVKGGRYDFLRNRKKLRMFFDLVLEPLLDISMNYPETIYAWELINEPEWVTRSRYWAWLSLDKNRTVPYGKMQDFLREGVERINNRRLPDGSRVFHSTVGFALLDTFKNWDAVKLGITAHQLHYYAPDKREMPENRFAEGSPVFIGEFATAMHNAWPDLNNLDAGKPISNRLANIESKGYHSAFLWSARAQDTATTWNESDHQDTIAFMNSRGGIIAGDVA